MSEEKLKLDNEDFHANLYTPDKSNRKGIILFHSWWGMNKVFTKKAKEYSSLGYHVIVPGFYRNRIFETIEEAAKYRDSLDWKQAFLIGRSSTKKLREIIGKNSQITAMGYSLGAFLASELTFQLPDQINKTVLIYGVGRNTDKNSSSEFQCHYASDDIYGADKANAGKFKEKLDSAGINSIFHFYDETKHWFCEENRPEYSKEKADVVNNRIIKFIEE